MRQNLLFVAFLFGCGALTGCSDSAQQPKSAAPPIEHGIYISSSDCAATGKLTINECGDAIDRAVSGHEATAPRFALETQCEDAFGADRCDRGVDGRYRPRLQAFFVTLAKPAHAVPLYPPAKSMVGFISPSHQAIDARDPTIRVSDAALSLAHQNSKMAGGGGDHAEALGAAAADIH